jgi:hypothetical protein
MKLTAGTLRAELHDVVADDRHTVGMHLGTGEREGRRFEDRGPGVPRPRRQSCGGVAVHRRPVHLRRVLLPGAAAAPRPLLVHGRYTAVGQLGERYGHQRSPAVWRNTRSAALSGHSQATLHEEGQRSSLPTRCREPLALGHDPVVIADGPHPQVSWEPSPPGASRVVLTGRATRVPQAAVTSGIQRSLTVNLRGPFVRMHAPDRGWARSPNCMACKRSRRIGWLSLLASATCQWSRRRPAATPVGPRRPHMQRLVRYAQFSVRLA